MATEILSAVMAQDLWDALTPQEQAEYNAHYTTMATWQIGETRDLIDDDEIAVAVVAGEMEGARNAIDWSGWPAMDAEHYLVARAIVGSEYNPATQIGAKLIDTTASNYSFLVRAGHNVHVENLGIDFSTTNGAFSYSIAGAELHLSRCTLTNNMSYTAGVNLDDSSAENCLFIINKGSETQVREWDTIENCTIIVKLGFGANDGNIIVRDTIATNVVVYNENPKISYDNYYQTTLLTCAQNDNGSTDLGAGNVNNILKTDFTDYDNGDFSLPLASALVDAATDLSSDFTTDIIGTIRG